MKFIVNFKVFFICLIIYNLFELSETHNVQKVTTYSADRRSAKFLGLVGLLTGIQLSRKFHLHSANYDYFGSKWNSIFNVQLGHTAPIYAPIYINYDDDDDDEEYEHHHGDYGHHHYGHHHHHNHGYYGRQSQSHSETFDSTKKYTTKYITTPTPVVDRKNMVKKRVSRQIKEDLLGGESRQMNFITTAATSVSNSSLSSNSTTITTTIASTATTKPTPTSSTSTTSPSVTYGPPPKTPVPSYETTTTSPGYWYRPQTSTPSTYAPYNSHKPPPNPAPPYKPSEHWPHYSYPSYESVKPPTSYSYAPQGSAHYHRPTQQWTNYWHLAQSPNNIYAAPLPWSDHSYSSEIPTQHYESSQPWPNHVPSPQHSRQWYEYEQPTNKPASWNWYQYSPPGYLYPYQAPNYLYESSNCPKNPPTDYRYPPYPPNPTSEPTANTLPHITTANNPIGFDQTRHGDIDSITFTQSPPQLQPANFNEDHRISSRDDSFNFKASYPDHIKNFFHNSNYFIPSQLYEIRQGRK